MRDANENTKKIIKLCAEKAGLDYQMVLDWWIDDGSVPITQLLQGFLGELVTA